MTSYHHQLALNYAALDIKVFPCREVPAIDAKGRPIKIKAPYTRDGYHDATTVKVIIDQWWTKHPDALVGIPCRANDFIVFDADRHDGPDGVAQMQTIFQQHDIDPSKLCCVTTAGNGEHYLFSNDVRLRDSIRGKLSSAIEVKYNGYIIAAGSILPDDTGYAVRAASIEQLAQAIASKTLPKLPEVFVGFLNKHTKTLFPATAAAVSGNTSLERVPDIDIPAELKERLSHLIPYVRKVIEDETCILAATASGNRDNQFNESCFRLGSLTAAEGIPDDVENVIKPFMRFATERNGLLDEIGFEEKFTRCFREGRMKPRTSLADSQRKAMEEITVVLPEGSTPAQPEAKQEQAVIRRIADVKTEPVRWLWRNRIALGKTTILAGDPGLGKSQLTAYITAKVTTGGEWANNEGIAELGSVLILSCEDDAGDTIKPRLLAAEANVSKVYVLEAIKKANGKLRTFSLEADIEHLSAFLKRQPDVKLAIIDPITAYLPTIDSHKTTDVRSILAMLDVFSKQFNVAILAVSHLNKNGGSGKAVNAITGSGAFAAAPRAAFLVAADKENPDQRLFLQVKNNLGRAAGLSFVIQEKQVEENINAPYVVFNEGTVNITANEALGVNVADAGAAIRDAAEEFLYQELKNGPVPADELFVRAKGQGISASTLRRAKKNCSIHAAKEGFQGQWVWSLPVTILLPDDSENAPKVASHPIDAHPQNMNTFEQAWSSLDKEDAT